MKTKDRTNVLARLAFIATGVAMALAVTGVALAVETKTWSQNEQGDYDKAKLDGIALRSDGRLSLAPALTELADTGAPYLWTMARDSKGNLYAAGGGPGGSTVKIYKFDVAGKSSALAEVEGLEIHALAIDAQDRVYAATAPDGKVYRIGADAKPAVFYDPKAKYIWAMAFSSKGDLFVATGDQGEVHRVTPDGRGSVFFRLEEAHARSLAIDSKDNVILGTDPAGLLVRVSPTGQGFVLHQMSKREVTAVLVARDGRIFAAATGNKGASTPVIPMPLPMPAPAPAPAQQAGAQARPAGPPQPPTLGPPVGLTGGSEVVELDADGAPSKLWSHAQDVAYSLAQDREGKLLIGTGNRGAIYRIETPSLATMIKTVATSQVTAVLAAPTGEIFAATANVGKVLRLGPGLEKKGTIESDVFDAGRFAFWGRLNQDEMLNGGTVRLETRSGNLDRPQKSWSAWSPLKDGRITSPAARFVQWRATLAPSADGKSPELAGIDVAWLAKNVAPRVEIVEATPANYKFPQPSASVFTSETLTLPPLGRSARTPGLSLDTSSSVTLNYAKGSAGVRWAASDDNGDTLLYRVDIRGANETAWKLLKEKIRERYVTFDTTAFPDGEYVVRVTATDAPSNPPGQALAAELVSSAFLIDNTAPAIENLSAQPAGGRVQLRFEARDAHNWISKAEYSINGVEWLVAEPVTKLTDSRELRYDLLLDRPQPGELTIAVRVTDEFDNQSTAKVVVR